MLKNHKSQVFGDEVLGAVRTVVDDGKVLFVANDVAKALGYQHTTDAITTHCKGVRLMHTLSNDGFHQIAFIPEGDVYRLIIHSEQPSAQKFASWVFDELIPSKCVINI